MLCFSVYSEVAVNKVICGCRSISNESRGQKIAERFVACSVKTPQYMLWYCSHWILYRVDEAPPMSLGYNCLSRKLLATNETFVGQ